MIGPGGRIINQIKDATKATIDLDEEGGVEVTAATVEAAQQAADLISLIVEDPPAGKVFRWTEAPGSWGVRGMLELRDLSLELRCYLR